MSTNDEPAIVSQMRQAFMDERANGRDIIQWRVSPAIDKIFRAASEPDENGVVFTYDLPEPTSHIDWFMGVVYFTQEDWTGERFEYDTKERYGNQSTS